MRKYLVAASLITTLASAPPAHAWPHDIDRALDPPSHLMPDETAAYQELLGQAPALRNGYVTRVIAACFAIRIKAPAAQATYRYLTEAQLDTASSEVMRNCTHDVTAP